MSRYVRITKTAEELKQRHIEHSKEFWRQVRAGERPMPKRPGRPKHGLSYTRLYSIWNNMMTRCYNPNGRFYKDYGGRGITVSDEWHNVEQFYKDMGHPPDGFSIERRNNNLGYSKDNCSWIPLEAQCKNRRSVKHFTFGDRTENLVEWARILGVKYSTLYMRINSGWSVEKAFSNAPAQ